MSQTIPINKHLVLDYHHLMQDVDLREPFTLKTIFQILDHAKIKHTILCRLFHIPNLKLYSQEIQKRIQKSHKLYTTEIEYLELRRVRYNWPNQALEENDDFQFEFDGVGYQKNNQLTRQRFSVELIPVNWLKNLPIKINPQILEYQLQTSQPQEKIHIYDIKDIKITVIELFYNILWELSFFGSPEKRNTFLKTLKTQVKNIKKINQR